VDGLIQFGNAIAITSINSNGTLYYSINNGTTWQAASALTTNALLLDNDSRVFFKPNTNWSGTTDNAFEYRAWDQSNTTAVIKAGALVNISATGGTTPYSQEVGKLGITVNAVNDVPTGDVTITGASQVGQELTATSTVADVDGLGTLTYSWYADGTVISGTTGTTYTLVAGDLGKTITAQVSYTDSAGTPEQVTSSPTVAVVAPVVLDLNRDGDLSYATVIMDVSNDGVLDNTLWAGMQDGVLVWDKYHDGKVHNHSQYAFTEYGGSTDLEGLAAGFDSNRDGVFSMADEKFGEFMVWQDADQDGVSDAGEVRSLADWGITQINLVSDGVQRTPAAGVIESGRSTANLADGGTMLVADAAFAYSTATDGKAAAHLASQLARAAEFQNKPYTLSAEEMAQLGLSELAASVLTGADAQVIAQELASVSLSDADLAEMVHAIAEMSSRLTLSPTVCTTAAESSVYSLSNGQSIDLSQVLKDMRLNGIDKGLEQVDMATDTSANVVSLSLADVLSLPSTDGVCKLILSGTANDKVMLIESEWTDTGAVINQEGHTYAVYTGTSDPSAHLLIDQYMLQSYQAS
jgi:hypothetical protein